MTAPRTTVDPWATVAEVRAIVAFGADVNPPSDADITTALAVASEILYHRSGRQFSGPVVDTVRPVHTCSPGWERYYHHDRAYTQPGAGVWPFESWSSITLGGYPVVSIGSVTIGADVISNSGYVVQDFRYLVRRGGLSWPTWQDMTVPLGQPFTWSVTYTHGVAPPASGKLACLRLAAEIAKGLAGQECSVPDTVTSVAQQGFSMAVISPPADWIMGLREVKTFVQAVNPGGLTRPPVVAGANRGRSVHRETG